MSCIHKENGPLTGLRFIQTGLELLAQEVGLLVRVGFSWQTAHLPAFQAHLLEKFFNLGQTAFETRQLFNFGGRFLQTGAGMLLKIFLQGRPMCL